MSAKSDTIGFLGCGQLGRALLDGWLESGRVRAEAVLVADPVTGPELVAAHGVRSVDAGTLAREAALIVLAVKPHQVEAALAPLTLGADQLVVSVAAGVRRATVASLASPARVVRTLPSTPCRVRQGVTLVLAGQGDGNDDVDRVVGLFEAVGHVERLADESLFHAATALAGSGPAYLFVAMDALADGAVAAGMPRALATRLAARTVFGAGALACVPGAHPAVLKDQVASPAGTTIRALQVLESRGLRAALIDAVLAAAERSRELEKP